MFASGPKFPVVSSLPTASTNAGRIFEQGGKLWWSDGTSWHDLTAVSGITVSTTAPSSPALNQLWLDTN